MVWPNDRTGRLLIVLGLAAVLLCGCGPGQPATAVAGPFVYVVNTKSNQISEYRAAASRMGALTPLTPSRVATRSFPYGIATEARTHSVYVADVNANQVSQYTLDPRTGQLTQKSPATVAAGPGAVEVAVTPDGKSAYVVDHDGVSQYSVNQGTGVLVPKSPAMVAAGGNSEAIAISPNGRYAYVANCPSCTVKRKGSHPAVRSTPPSKAPSKAPTSTIWEYRINQHTGALTHIGTVATGSGANGIAITPDGRSLYIAINAIWQYTINPVTGKLTPKAPATVSAPGAAHELKVAPDGKNAYAVTVANNKISQYRIEATTGVLSSHPASSASTVPHPEAITLGPDGKNAYVTSENAGRLSQFTINSSNGKITPMSPATVTTASGSLGIATVTPAEPSHRER